jgi:predicted RNA binding protein YcfA (HicA-like mRNA interferase family)
VNYRQVIDILQRHGFSEIRCKGSHHLYEGFVGNLRRLVTVAYHKESQDVAPGTLASMIRQSGLGKTDFK